jgi:hypothetical protein
MGRPAGSNVSPVISNTSFMPGSNPLSCPPLRSGFAGYYCNTSEKIFGRPEALPACNPMHGFRDGRRNAWRRAERFSRNVRRKVLRTQPRSRSETALGVACDSALRTVPSSSTRDFRHSVANQSGCCVPELSTIRFANPLGEDRGEHRGLLIHCRAGTAGENAHEASIAAPGDSLRASSRSCSRMSSASSLRMRTRMPAECTRDGLTNRCTRLFAKTRGYLPRTGSRTYS